MGPLFADGGEGVTAKDVLAMCEFAEGEAGFEIQEQGNESEKGGPHSEFSRNHDSFCCFSAQKRFSLC